MTQWLHPWVDPVATPTDSGWVYLCYGRTYLRTYGDLWLSSRDHLTFSDARAHIPDSSQPRRSSAMTRQRAIQRARQERTAS